MNRHESEVIPIKTPVSRVGNKTSILHILYALFPLNYGRFIDVFGGSGSVLLGNPTVSSFEVYNDFDRNLANLFHCMKNFYVATPVSWGIVIVDYCLITVAPDFILCVSAAVFSAKLRPVFAGILNGYSVKNKVENKA